VWTIPAAAPEDGVKGPTVKTLDDVLVSISEQFDRAMTARRASIRKWSWRSGRSTTGSAERALKAKNMRLSTIVELAHGLDCDVEVKLVPRRLSEHPHPTSSDGA
jgi:hypothetical protein